MDRKITFTIGLTTQDGQQLDREQVITNVVVPKLAAYGVDGFSITNNVGYWKGQAEESITVTVFCNHTHGIVMQAHAVAYGLALACRQEAVLYSIENCHADLAYA